MGEHEIQNQIRLAIGETQAGVMFRANVGAGWNGNLVSQANGRVVLNNARRLTTGLPKGFPDLFGFKTVEITPDMVGKKIAVFAFLEVKAPKGKPSEAQREMHKFLLNGGAIGGIAHSPEEAIAILNGA